MNPSISLGFIRLLGENELNWWYGSNCHDLGSPKGSSLSHIFLTLNVFKILVGVSLDFFS